jgi:hypothetical protein
MGTVVVIDGSRIELEGIPAALVRAVVEFQAVIPQQDKLQIQFDVAGFGREVRVRPMPVYVFNKMPK